MSDNLVCHHWADDAVALACMNGVSSHCCEVARDTIYENYQVALSMLSLGHASSDETSL